MGSYGKGEPFSTFLIQGDGSQGRPRPELLRLRGARLIRCIEVSENMRWDSALLNTLVSGEPYAARALFSNDLIEFVPVFKLWCAANHRAKVRYNPEEEDGFWRRLYPIPFQVEIPEDQQDKGLKQYFMTDPDARAAILAEILQGATEWYNLSDRGRINGLHAPPAIITARFDYKAAQSPIYEFLKNECRVGKDAITGEPYRVAVRDLWDLFSDARKGYDTKKVKTPVSLGRYLKGLGFGKEKVKDVRYSVGLRLLKEDEEPDEVFSLRTDGQLESTNLKSSNESSLHEGEIRKEGPNCPTVFDHAELVRTIHETMIAWPSPQHGKKPNCNYFVAAVAAHIRQRYPQWLGRNIEYEINRLNECDSEIQSILAERTVCID